MSKIQLEFLEMRTLLSGSGDETPAKKKSGGFPNPFKIVKSVAKVGADVAKAGLSVAGSVVDAVVGNDDSSGALASHTVTPTPTASASASPSAVMSAAAQDQATSATNNLAQTAETLKADITNLANSGDIETIVNTVTSVSATDAPQTVTALNTLLESKVTSLDSISIIITAGNAEIAPDVMTIMEKVTEMASALIDGTTEPSKVLEASKILEDLNNQLVSAVAAVGGKIVAATATNSTLTNTTVTKEYHGLAKITHSIGHVAHDVKGGVKFVVGGVVKTGLNVAGTLDKQFVKALTTIGKKFPGGISAAEKAASKILLANSKLVTNLTNVAQKITTYNQTEVNFVVSAVKAASVAASLANTISSIVLAAVGGTGYGAAVSIPLGLVVGGGTGVINAIAANPAIITTIFQGIDAAGKILGVAGDDLSAALSSASALLTSRSAHWTQVSQVLNNSTATAIPMNVTVDDSSVSSANTTALNQEIVNVQAA